MASIDEWTGSWLSTVDRDRLGALAVTAVVLLVLLAGAQSTSGSQFSGTVSLSDADATVVGEDANETVGKSVTSAGDVDGDGVDDLIVGAPRNDSGGDNAGAAYVVYGPADPGDVSVSDADVTLLGESARDLAGWSVSAAGDVNGDGVDDVVVGAPYNDTGAPNAGAAYVIYGNDSLPATMNLSDADAVLVGTERNARAGHAVSDVDRSNATDGVLVGAPYSDEGGAESGAAYLVDGEPRSKWVNLTDADATFVGERNGSHAGWSVSTAGDVDADGREEVLVGAPRYNATADWTDSDRRDDAVPRAGAAYVANGSADGTVSLANATATVVGASAGDRAGWSVSDAGDVTDDGVDDLLVGAPFNDSAATDAGAAYVVDGGEDFGGNQTLADAAVRMAGEAFRDRAGWSVSAAGSGDVTCDDVDDVLVGAPFNDSSAIDAGAAYMVSGNASLDGAENLSDADAKFVGESPRDQAGRVVSEAGDLNDDGFEDVAVGAPRRDGAATNAGAAYVAFAECGEDGPGYGYGYGDTPGYGYDDTPGYGYGTDADYGNVIAAESAAGER